MEDKTEDHPLMKTCFEKKLPLLCWFGEWQLYDLSLEKKLSLAHATSVVIIVTMAASCILDHKVIFF